MPESELFQLLQRHSPAQAVLSARTGERGLADETHFPFLALVSQTEMKLALVLTLINPAAGGVLLIGPRGTGKTTAMRGLKDSRDRLQVYRRVSAYQANPHALRAMWAAETVAIAQEIAQARACLPRVKLTPQVERTGMVWVKRLRIDSHRAEIVLFEAARAHAAAEGRAQAELSDLRAVASMALRQRRSRFMDDYLGAQAEEERELAAVVRAPSACKGARR